MEREKLFDKIRQFKPNIKDSSVNMYVHQINKLQSLYNTATFGFIDNIEDIEEKLKDHNYLTKRNFLNAIIIIIQMDNSNSEKQELLEKYQGIRDELSGRYQKENETGKISEKQRDGFIEYSKLVDCVKELKKQTTSTLRGEYKLSLKQSQILNFYIVLSIHITFPLRNDLAETLVITKRKYNKLTMDEKKKNNFLVMGAKPFFSLNKYKTSKIYEENIIDIGKDLKILLTKFVKIIGYGPLIKNANTGDALNRNSLTQFLLKYTKEYIGTAISTTMIRKIVMSHHFLKNKKAQSELAKVAGHSVETQNLIYVKEV
jgi:hypothetical protein